jgi:hypothetical protein
MPFLQQKHVKWQNNYLQNIIDTAIYIKPYPAVSLADDKIGLFMAKWYRQFKCPCPRFRLMIEENMHVVMTLYTFLMVKFETCKMRWALWYLTSCFVRTNFGRPTNIWNWPWKSPLLEVNECSAPLTSARHSSTLIADVWMSVDTFDEGGVKYSYLFKIF